eukprot:3323600-Rhodomonas_salina.2
MIKKRFDCGLENGGGRGAFLRWLCAMADQNDREEEDYEVAYQLQMQETLDATRRSGSQEAAQRADQGDEKSTKLCFAGRPCGYGAVILLPDGDVMWSKGQHLDETTNTKAAYAGLLAGLQACRDFGIDQVIAEGDSELLVKQMNGESAASDPNLVHLVKEVRAIVQYMSSFKLRFIHKRNNAMADQLAHDAAPRQSGAKRRRGSDDVAEVFVVDEEVAEPCGICLENVSIKQIHVVGECSHRFCKSCLDTLIAQHATDKKFPVPCPAPQCITTISTAECAALTSSAPALEILQKLEVETCIPASQRFYCPHASCSALMTRPDDLSETGNNAAECLECHRMVQQTSQCITQTACACSAQCRVLACACGAQCLVLTQRRCACGVQWPGTQVTTVPSTR